MCRHQHGLCNEALATRRGSKQICTPPRQYETLRAPKEQSHDRFQSDHDPFTADSTASGVVEHLNLSGFLAIVTGGSSGIGIDRRGDDARSAQCHRRRNCRRRHQAIDQAHQARRQKPRPFRGASVLDFVGAWNGHPPSTLHHGYASHPAIKSPGAKPTSRTRRSSSRAHALLCLAAITLGQRKTAPGAFYRRLAERIGEQKAVTATARKIAGVFYNALRFGMTYRDPDAAAHNEQHRGRIGASLHPGRK